jgi:Carboxypeptidase regulatory-like domain
MAQSATGSISGIVTDASGAVLSDAAITITDLARKTEFRTLSNATGLYVVPTLPPGSYQLKASKPGFHEYVLDAIPLSTQQKAAVNVRLELGAVSQQLEVRAGAQLIEPSTSSLSAIVENKRIEDLPLNGRNIFSLASLVPGVATARQLTGIGDTFLGNRFIVNGSQEATSAILMDGVTVEVPSNAPTIPIISSIPSVEGVQEFRIQTNAYSAEYGRSGGGVVTMASKSGTNQIHGDVFEYLRNSMLDANNFFANSAGLPLASFKRNQFGASVGGPVYVPKVYNGKNHSFFYFTYEGQRIAQAQFAQQTVPTDLQRRGDFSQTLNAAGQVVTIYDPFSTRLNPDKPGTFLRDPFPANAVPQGRMDPVAVNAQKFYPLPNSPGLPFTHQNNFVVQSSIPQPQDRTEFKIDHVFNDRRRVFGRYTHMDSMYSKPNFWGNIADPGCCDPMNQRLQNGALDYTDTLNNTTVVNVRYGFARIRGNRFPWSNGFSVQSLGLPGSIDSVANGHVFPTITIQDMTQLGPNGGDYYLLSTYTHTLVADVMKVFGRHSLKFGTDIRFNYVNNAQLGQPNVSAPSGEFGFARDLTQGPDPRVPSTLGGVGYASFLLGTGSGAISHQVLPANANRYFGFYAQDDFKLSSKLTVNLGLRWDLETGETERHDSMSAIDLSVQNPLSRTSGLDVRGGYLFAGSSLGRHAIRDAELRKWNPRVGFAYLLNPKTVIRSGYGIFFGAAPYTANSAYVGGAFSSSTPWVGTLDGITPHDLLRNPFPSGFNLPRGSADGLLTQVGLGLNGPWPQAMMTPYNQQWNFTVQRSIGEDLVLELAYAGNKGTHLAFYTAQMDQLNPQYLTLGNQLFDQVTNPFFGQIQTGVLAQPTVQRGYLLRPFPEFNGSLANAASWGNSNYQALQARFEKRYSRGLSLLAAYTWSKTISDGVDGFWAAPWGNMRNWYCRTCDRAISAYDQPHRFVLNATYELPFGRGKSIGSNWTGPINRILGGWQVNGILTLSVGQPIIFYTAQNTTFSYGGGQRPDSTGISPDLGGARTISRWFDTSQILQPQPFTFGNLARNSDVRSDNAKNLDFSLFKDFRFREKIALSVRGEAFNMLNTPLFGAPNTVLGSPTFGRVLAQENLPRQVQLGMKLLF